MHQDLMEACKILNITDLNSLNRESLRKCRKKALKIYHPDIVGEDTAKSRDISIAYNKVLEYITLRSITNSSQSRSVGKKKILMRMETLMTLCKGGSVDAGDGFGTLRYGDLKLLYTMIKIEYTVWINGDRRDCVCIQNFNIGNQYEIAEYIDYKSGDKVEIELYGNRVEFVGNGDRDIIKITAGQKGDLDYPKVNFILLKDDDSD